MGFLMGECNVVFLYILFSLLYLLLPLSVFLFSSFICYGLVMSLFLSFLPLLLFSFLSILYSCVLLFNLTFFFF